MLPSPSITRQRAIETARDVLRADPVYLDTETTGLKRSDEIIEISIIDDTGQVLYQSLVKPTQRIPAESTRINGISDEDVRSAPAWPLIWTQVRGVLFGRTVVIYNQEFDLRMLQQTHARYGLALKDKFKTVDLQKIYSEFRGEWDPIRRSYRLHSLDAAGRHSQIHLPNAHRATADTLLTRALLHFIADCAI